MEQVTKKPVGRPRKTAVDVQKNPVGRPRKSVQITKNAPTGTREVVMYSDPKRNPKKSRTTVAAIIDFDKKTISVHGARNNTTMKEVFKRNIGRSIALGRAKKHPLFVVKFKENQAREMFYGIANELIRKPYRISEDPILVSQRKSESKEIKHIY